MLVIRNKGEIELAALTLIGASSKEGDNSKIGFFGSGNKYAIATLLRKGVPFEIYSGTRRVEIETRPMPLRGETFDQIIIDGQPTSMTTRMGPDWETWYALREFICNAMDEGEDMVFVGEPVPEEGYTTIAVDATDEVTYFCDNLIHYIRTDEPLCAVKDVFGGSGIVTISLYPSRFGKLNVYRKGVSVIGKLEVDALYSYNISGLALTESRTIKYTHEPLYAVAAFFANCEDADVIRNYLHNCKGMYEEELRWSPAFQFSKVWETVFGDATVAPSRVESRVIPEDRHAYIFIQNELFDVIKDKVQGPLYIGREGYDGFTATEPTKEEKEKLDAGLARLAECGITIDNEIVFGFFRSSSTLAAYNTETEEILISAACFDCGHPLEALLYEEHCHALGYDDGTRRFEQFLIKELLATKRGFEVMRKAVAEVIGKEA